MPSLPGPALAITNAALTLFHGKAAFHHDSSDSYWRRRGRFRRGPEDAPVTAPFRFPRFFVTSPSPRSEEHTSELQSLMRISYAVFCLTKKQSTNNVQQTE